MKIPFRNLKSLSEFEWVVFVCFPHLFQAGRGLSVSISSGSRVSWRALGEWTGLFIFLPQLVGHSIWAFLSSTHICIFLNVAIVSRSFACFHWIFNNYWVLYLVYFWNIVPDFEIFFLSFTLRTVFLGKTFFFPIQVLWEGG